MNNFIQNLLEFGICIAFFYSVYWVFLKKETYFTLNRIYLISAVVFSSVIPIFNIPSPFIKASFTRASESYSQFTSIQTQSFNIFDLIPLIYFLISGFFLVRFLIHLFNLYLTIRKCGVTKHKGLNVVFIDKRVSPFSFFNFIFIGDSNISKNNFNRIIAHERVHIKQYHSIDILIVEFVAIFQWFNPFVWPYKKSLKETHEYLADSGVIAQGFSTVKYQLLIFEQHVGAKLFEFANNFHQSQIKRRITMMTKIKSKGWARLKLLLIVPMASLLVLAFAESNPVEETQLPGGNNAAYDVQADPDTSAGAPLQTQEQKESEEQKKKEQLKKMELEKQKKLTKIKEYAEALKEKEMKITEELNAVKDPEKKSKLKRLLKDIQKQKIELKKEYKMIVDGEPNSQEVQKITLIKLKEEAAMLMEKAQAVREKLKKVEDPERKAELKAILKNIEEKMMALKKEMKKLQEAEKKAKNKEKD